MMRYHRGRRRPLGPSEPAGIAFPVGASVAGTPSTARSVVAIHSISCLVLMEAAADTSSSGSDLIEPVVRIKTRVVTHFPPSLLPLISIFVSAQIDAISCLFQVLQEGGPR